MTTRSASLKRSAVLGTLVLATLACRASLPRAEAPPHTLVLVSIDGFRSDYFERLPTPELHRLAARGVRAARLIPVFPSKTFPNHYTLVTGRWPEHHGIVANEMFDPQHDAWFSLADRAAVENPMWWQAEPIWVTAERRGLRTATMFWPGSEAPIGGIRPTWWRSYDGTMPAAKRVGRVLEWLALPPAERPRFLTLYFEAVDTAGHEHGPESPELAAAVSAIDDEIGALLDGLDRLRLRETTDVVVVSDHGMATLSPSRRIVLDDWISVERAQAVTWSPVLELWPPPEDVEKVYAALRDAHPHLHVYRREDLPARFHYRENSRIPPIVALADEGWHVTSRAALERQGDAEGKGGDHGYDPALPSMGALFVAAGPSFAHGRTVPAFENVEVYPLLCIALGIAPLPGDWTLSTLPRVLSRPPARRL